MAVNGVADRVAVARDLVCRLPDVIDELDIAVNAMRHAVFAADGVQRADRPAQHAMWVVEYEDIRSSPPPLRSSGGSPAATPGLCPNPSIIEEAVG